MPIVFNTLEDLLYHHRCKEKGEETHTRIPDNSKGIYGGKYLIPEELTRQFHKLYHKKVFIQMLPEYLTEKQLQVAGPVLVDLDFRYKGEVTERQHTPEHIEDLVEMYVEQIREMVKWEPDTSMRIYVLEKPNANVSDPAVTKDGIHLIFGIRMSYSAQLLLRDGIKEEIGNILEDLPLINSYDSVLDAGISKGTTNWQMFGSRKPGHEAYELVHLYDVSADAEGLVELEERPLPDPSGGYGKVRNLFLQISARNQKIPDLPLTAATQAKINAYKQIYIKKARVKVISVQIRHDFAEITGEGQCREMAEQIVDRAKRGGEYQIKQAHDYTMILGEEHYDPYQKWISVGWALKTTSYSLFPTWMLFSCKSKHFTWNKVPEFLKVWSDMDIDGGLTFRSIMYWAKEADLVKYKEVQRRSIEYYINRILESDGEWDIAQLVFQMFGDHYKCVNIRNKVWYEYQEGRWKPIDSGITLRRKLSTNLVKLLRAKVSDYLTATYNITDGDGKNKKGEELQKKIITLNNVCIRLRRTGWKTEYYERVL